MKRATLTLAATTAMLIPMLHPALALNVKSFIASNGNDNAACTTPATACATFGGVIGKTAPGGDVIVVDAGNYGPIIIDKSLNITNDGVGEASVMAVNFNGVFIGAGSGDIVSLRGLVIDGQNAPGHGMVINQISAVHVQHCVIRNFSASGVYGIDFSGFPNGQLFVSDTIIFNNGSTMPSGGIHIDPLSPGQTRVVLDRVRLENNVIGLWVDGTHSNGSSGAYVVVRDSVISGNAADGILASSVAGKAPAFVFVEHSSSVNNGGIGIHADGPHAIILLNDNTITRNGAGMSATNSGQLISFGNNKNANNAGPEGAPTGLYNQM